MAIVEIIHTSYLFSDYYLWEAIFIFSFVWLSPCGDCTPQRECGCSSWTKCRATLSVHCRHSAVDTSTYILYVMCRLKCTFVWTHAAWHACSLTSNDTRKARVVKERTRESEEQRVHLPQVLKLCINKQDLLDCPWHFCSVGRSVSSLIFNKTSQPSNAFPSSVSRY